MDGCQLSGHLRSSPRFTFTSILAWNIINGLRGLQQESFLFQTGNSPGVKERLCSLSSSRLCLHCILEWNYKAQWYRSLCPGVHCSLISSRYAMTYTATYFSSIPALFPTYLCMYVGCAGFPRTQLSLIELLQADTGNSQDAYVHL